MIKAVIFDLGGVLMRTEDVGPRQALAARLGVSRQELEHLVFNSTIGLQAQLGQITADELWQEVGAALRLTPEQIAALQDAFWDGDRLDAGLVDFIRGLRPRFTTALLSNAWNTLRAYMQDTWGIADAFHHLVISAEVGMMKPDPRIYRLALERVGVAPEEAVFIDDFPENIDAARAVGLQAIHFRTADQVLADLAPLLQAGSPPATA